MKKMILLAGLALAGFGTAQAQNEVVWLSGRVINGPAFDLGHRLMFSQHDNIYGTSRVTAMGGAFTSLGADLSSISINPAGLGMYQTSDWGMTAVLTMDGMHTASRYMQSGALRDGGKKTSFGFNNIGAAYNVYNGSGTLTSVTLGFSYNRAANFNSQTNFNTFGDNSTIGEVFSNQINLMTGGGVPIDALNYDNDPWRNDHIYTEEWAAVLGWQTYVVDDIGNGTYGFYTDAIPSDGYFRSVTKGGIYEYNFSMGANLANFLYLGATVGINDINFTEDTTYEEYYAPTVPLESLWFDQRTHITGTSLTAKLGLVARPVEALRIGVAFHLPTYYTIEKSYYGEMGTKDVFSDTGDLLMDGQHFNTAPRLLAGISGIIAQRAIVALDWEVDWNNKIRRRGVSDNDIEVSRQESQDLYKPAHTFRAGFEFLLSDMVSLRAGGSWMNDFMRNKGTFNPTHPDNPAIRSSYSVTAGLGFNIGRSGYLDMAYVYNRAKLTDYDLYFYDDGASLAGQWDMSGSTEYDRFYSPTRTRHMITLTLGSRF